MSRALYTAFAFYLVSCAGLNRPSEHVVQGAKLTPYGGFHSLRHNPKELRMGWNTKGEKWAIETWVIDIAAMPVSPEAFKNQVKENEPVYREKGKYEVLEYGIEDYASKGSMAVLSKFRVKDKSADPRYAFVDAYELSCIHPSEKTLGYNVLVSRRGNSAAPDSAFDGLAMKILESFAFTEP